MTSDNDEWEPEPAELRDPESVTESAHAQANLAAIRQHVADGDLDEAAYERAVERVETGGEE